MIRLVLWNGDGEVDKGNDNGNSNDIGNGNDSRNGYSITILIAVTETITVTTTVTITIRDCAMIIRRRRPKNESRKEKYYTIPPLSTKAN